jgi:hypothetical protein
MGKLSIRAALGAVQDRDIGQRVESWVVTDDFWQRMEPLIPARSEADKIYMRKPGTGVSG